MAAVAKTMAPEARATEAAPLVEVATEPVLELLPDVVVVLVVAAVEDEPAAVAAPELEDATVTVVEDEPAAAADPEEAVEPEPHVDW